MSKEKYDATILELVQLITSASVSQMGKAEFFGYTLDHLIHHYVRIQEGRSDRFNADLFPAGTKNSLDLLTHRLAALVGPEDPLEAAKDLHYVIARVLEAMLALPNVSSGMSLFLKGSIHKTIYKIQTDPGCCFALRPAGTRDGIPETRCGTGRAFRCTLALRRNVIWPPQRAQLREPAHSRNCTSTVQI